jgi:hypothetical protein
MFAGLAGTAGYLPQEGIAISVFVTFESDAFVAENDYFTANASGPLFASLAAVMAPDHPVPTS